MDDTNSNSKIKGQHRCGRNCIRTVAAAVILLAVLVSTSVQYYRFVSRTIYDESTSHLSEILHQSNNMLNEVVEKNLAYLHMWTTTLRNFSDEKTIQNYVETVRQETGANEFYFLSAEGNYMTPSGESGYLGLTGNPEKFISQGEDLVMNATLPGKPQLLVFATTVAPGEYRGFAYDAIGISFYNEDIINELDISAFQESASRYVTHSDGRIVINREANQKEIYYNFFALLQEHSNIGKKEMQALSEDFQQGNSGNRLVTLDGNPYYLSYESVGIHDWMIVGLVPAAIVNESIRALQSSTVAIVSIVVLIAAGFIIVMILRRSSTNLRQKNTEILYQDELFQKLAKNIDDVFMMIDADSAKADYVSPNVERLLGISVEEIKGTLVCCSICTRGICRTPKNII